MKAARSAVEGCSAMDDETDDDRDEGAAAVGDGSGGVACEDRLECDTRLSRALALRVAGPPLRSS